MITQTQNELTFIKDIDELTKRIETKKTPRWLKEIRQESLSRFTRMGLPRIKDEEWKYTNIAPLAQHQFTAASKFNVKESTALKNYLKDFETAIVYVNGTFSAQLSKIKKLPGDVTILSLEEAILKDEAVFKELFSKKINQDENVFVVLNKALGGDGIYIHLTKKTVYEDVIHIIHLTDTDEKIITLPRTVINLEEGSEATVLESHISLSDEPVYLSNALTDIFLAEHAVMHYCKAQKESSKAFHIGNTRVFQKRNSSFDGFSLMVGASLTRNNLDLSLNGEGGSAILNGLYCVNETQHVDNHTCVDHREPNCTSNQLYKGILNGSSRGVFNGKIFVRPMAQKTNSYQLNKNLLLGKNSRIDTKPQLEIFADDVKCTHGATIGQLNEDEVFYFQSRAIGKKDAVRMLCHGFVDDILNTIRHEVIREKMNILLEPTFRSL